MLLCILTKVKVCDLMPVKIPWDKYEAAILLDAWLKVKDGIPKAHMVNLVSFYLRQKAINQNIEIDEIYRNTNGISFQMTSMASAYEQINMGKTATKLFTKIIELYQSDYESYKKILKEAMQMIEYSSALKDDFLIYLNHNQPQNVDKIIEAIETIEKFAISTKALSHSVYEELTEVTITTLRKKVLNHKFFTVRFKSILKYAEMGLQMLSDYITEKTNTSNEEHIDSQITTSNPENLPITDKQDNTVQITLYKETEGFYNWMFQNANLSINTSRSYNSAINTCDAYARQAGIFQDSIRNCSSYSEYEEKYTLLMNNSGFRKLSEEKHNYLVTALNKYYDYMIYASTGVNPLPQASTTEDISTELAKKCSEILMQEFDDGYCIGDYMHQMRFQSAYKEMYGEELNKDGDELDSLLKKIGQMREDRIFYSSNSDTSLLASIYMDIATAFDNGATAVYHECLYKKYESKLTSEMNIYSSDSLKSIMQNDSNFPKDYSIMKLFVTKHGVNIDSNEEIRKLLQNSHVPMTFDKIRTGVWHIPIDRIKHILRHIPEAVRVDESTYFYAPNFYMSDDEKIALINAMRSTISSKGYLVAKDLREIFRNACPSAAMDSEHFKDYSIREILKILLREEFEFSSSVVTEKDNQLDYSQVFQNYAAERERITLSELQELKKELGLTVIYWDSIFKEMIRISDTELVQKGIVQFNIPAIDEVLEQMYPDEYTALKDVDLFLAFPPVNVRWNGFLLESYLREYSEKFRLIQLSISQDDYFGVMLKRSSDLKNYNDIAADMLARNNNWSDEKSALQLLKEMNFQQRAQNSNISAIIKAAKQKRINLD